MQKQIIFVWGAVKYLGGQGRNWGAGQMPPLPQRRTATESKPNLPSCLNPKHYSADICKTTEYELKKRNESKD